VKIHFEEHLAVMSKGLGRIQRECLRVIDRLDAMDMDVTTLVIAAEVYGINHIDLTSDAQRVAVKRALAGLRRKGLVIGKQMTMMVDGKKMLAASDGGKSARIIAAKVGISYHTAKRYLEKQGEEARPAQRCAVWRRRHRGRDEATPAARSARQCAKPEPPMADD
jgi:hypothetical protein